MSNKTTWLLLGVVIVIFGVIGIGFITSQPNQPSPPKPVTKSEPKVLSENELTAKLAQELPIIEIALATALPRSTELYTLERTKLYHDGNWFGAILQYKGTEANSRDTLRLVMHKEKGAWLLKTTPPQLLLSKQAVPDAPEKMIDDINRPAPLAGTENSPAIIPSE